MKAVATDGRGSLIPTELPRPTGPEGGALVRVLTCGLCGSDVEKILDPGFPAGRVLGHEVVGVLDGSRGGQRSDGRRVAVAHHVPCGSCRDCLAGHSSLCAQFTSTDLEPGGFAEELAVGPRHLEDAVFHLPDEIDDLTGTLVEPLSCVLRALDAAAGALRAFPRPGVTRSTRAFVEVPRPHIHLGGEHPEDDPARLAKRVAVAGCGSVGLLFLATLSRADRLGTASGDLRPEDLLFLEPNPERAALARRLGAREPRDDDKVDLAFVTAPAAFGPMLERLRPGGVLVVFAAGRTGEQAPMTLDHVYRGELTILGVRSGSPSHLRRALEVLGAGRLPLDWFSPLETDLEGLPGAVERYVRGEVLKVVVRP